MSFEALNRPYDLDFDALVPTCDTKRTSEQITYGWQQRTCFALISILFSFYNLANRYLNNMDAPTPAEVSYWRTHSHDSRIPTIIAVDALCFSFAAVAIASRFISRLIMKSGLMADDWMIVVGYVRLMNDRIVY